MSTASAAPPVAPRPHSTSRHGYTSSQSGRTSSTPSRSSPPPYSTTLPRANSQSYHPHRPSSSQHHQPPPAQPPPPPPPQQPPRLSEVLPHRDYETSHLVHLPGSPGTASGDGSRAYQPAPARTGSVRSSHYRASSRSGNGRPSMDVPPMAPAMSNGDSIPVRPSLAAGEGSDHAVHGSAMSVRRRTVTGASGQWVLGKTIGSGSMGKVKLAKKMETGEQVAVKIVPRQTPDDGRGNRDRERQDHSKEVRTAREAAIVTLLDHPYICGMRDVVRTPHHWYMLFEYVNGGQMLDYIISHGRLKEKQARKFARQIASALDYCHRNSIAHRDLKIENILISKTGDIRIIDFGLSNLYSPRDHLKTFCGSLYFAAPELLQARQYTGPEVDIWSFGVVLYVLVCGKVPFDDQSMPQLHAKIKKGLVDYPPYLSAECKHIISRMLVTDPKQRASLQEIIAHPWMCKGFSAHLDNHLPHREPLQLPLDPDVVQGMTGFDFGPADLIASRLTRVLESEEYQQVVRAAAREQSGHAPATDRRRGFPAFDFYKRRSSTTSRDTLPNPSSEGFPALDPVNAYHPLISVYHLVKEKQRRLRQESGLGASSLPRVPGDRPIRLPELPVPPEAHTNTSRYEMAGEAATGGRHRPRARTNGEDDITAAMQHVSRGAPAAPPTPAVVTPHVESAPAKRESAAAGLLRRLSTRRHRDPERERPARPPPVLTATPPMEERPAPIRPGISVRRTRERDGPPVSTIPAVDRPPPPAHDLLLPPETIGARPRRGVPLGRSTSVNSGEGRRRSPSRDASDGPPNTAPRDPPLRSSSNRSSVDGYRARLSEAGLQASDLLTSGARAAASRARSLGHPRRQSVQPRRPRREEMKEADLPEETDQDLAASGGSGDVARSADRAENVRPVYLKGLFSVSTTSPKPVPAIRAEILRVLRQLGLAYTEIRGGFRCTHRPSIDLRRVQDVEPVAGDRATSGLFGVGTRRRISLGALMGAGDRDDFRDQPRPPASPRTPRRPGHDGSPALSEESDVSIGKTAAAPGETTTHVQSELSGSLILTFEIYIVKVPILALHGIQFKRVAGGTWQYKNMADKILKEARL